MKGRKLGFLIDFGKFTCSWIWIRIPSTDPDPGQLNECGAVWIRIHNIAIYQIAIRQIECLYSKFLDENAHFALAIFNVKTHTGRYKVEGYKLHICLKMFDKIKF